MSILIAFATSSIVASILTVSACMLSARISRREALVEVYVE
jgi:hypothetical protein